MRIAIVPLDERPVNTRLPAMVTAIAGADTVLPPADMLPWMRQAGDADAVADWLTATADSVDAVVVSLDMLGYGGLIPSRTSADRVSDVLGRLAVLEQVRESHPDLPMSGVTTVLRASNSYNAGEEPDYWSQYGVELHQLGGALHRRFLAEQHGAEEVARLVAAVPAPIRHDFLRRRLRNHTVDLYAVELAASGVLRPMMVTADDTAEWSAGSLEQHWLSGWIDALDLGENATAATGGQSGNGGTGETDAAVQDVTVRCYPGADEVGAVLAAAALAARLPRRPRIAVLFPDEQSAQRVAPYENVAVAETVRNQILAAGAVPETALSQAHAILVVHPPAAERDGASSAVTAGSTAGRAADQEQAAAAVLELVRQQSTAAILGVADVWRPNGSDPALVDGLVERDLLSRLAAYGGWNTAGNTIGSVVAALVAGIVGRKLGSHDPTAERRLLLHRLVEDYGYQAVVRTRLADRRQFANHVSAPFDEPEDQVDYLAECVPQLEAVLAGFDREWRIGDVELPWNRTFEIDFTVTPSSEA